MFYHNGKNLFLHGRCYQVMDVMHFLLDSLPAVVKPSHNIFKLGKKYSKNVEIMVYLIVSCHSSVLQRKKFKKGTTCRVFLNDPTTPSVFGSSNRKRIYFESKMAAYYRDKRRPSATTRGELL
jgi:hypothetical protein